MLPWKTIDSRYLLKRPWINLREDHVQLPNGTEMEEFYVVEYPAWAAVLCLTEAGQVVMVEQYRHGIQQVTLELPAGVVDRGERPLLAARRELLEETGYVAEEWVSLGRCAPNPSKHTNFAYLFLARGARRRHAPRLDNSEAIDVRLLDVEEVLHKADTGDIVHGIHLALLFRAQHRGLLQKP
jgi:8-oxo-dGTP pyrophosphatase MutT (NUDIX family)